MQEKYYALELAKKDSQGNPTYRIGTLDMFKEALDWIVFEVFWEQYSFKEVVKVGDKWSFV